MQTRPIQLNDVTYNAVSQCFEALVIVCDDSQSRKYACAINAPLDMSFEDAAKGLSTQALRRHKARGGIYSEFKRPVPAQRAGRRDFDPMRWLENIVDLPRRRAA